jgi:DNA-binding NarL/FixJ family response regulator
MSEISRKRAPADAAGSVISIALIEDNRLVREGIASLLNQLPDLRVVAGEFSDDSSLLKSVNPQVVLLDLGLGRGTACA